MKIFNLFFRGILSTYKELCSLVIDLNRPKLLYKFIQLANYNKKKVGMIVLFTIKQHAFINCILFFIFLVRNLNQSWKLMINLVNNCHL